MRSMIDENFGCQLIMLCFFFLVSSVLFILTLVESRATLLSNELKRHLFNLFASWSGPSAKPLGVSHAGFSGISSNGGASTAGASSNNNSLGISGTIANGACTSLGSISIEEEKLQFGALQVSQFTVD